jgi:hypothetical protein
MRYGSTSPSEFDEMEPEETYRLASRIAKFRRSDDQMLFTLAKLVAQSRLSVPPQEVR